MNRCKKLLAAVIAVILLLGAMPEAEATATGVQVDYSELQLLVGTVNGLNSYDFTRESWEPLQKAVDTGKRYLKGRFGQQAVNEAVTDIEEAMVSLVRMDYSKLESVLAIVHTEIDKNPELHDLWGRLNTAVAEARPLMVSGDQKAVNEAVVQLEQLLAELEAFEEPVKEPEVVIQEVEVEVPPTDDYCNIPSHRLWPILFAASMAANVGLIAGVVYITLKRRNTVDNTPLVSYDIEDDFDF